MRFLWCRNLKSITIPDSVIGIGSAFYECNNITKATYKGKSYDFEHIDLLYDAINLGESGMRIVDGVLKAVSRVFAELVIPDGVTAIGNHAFHNHINLVSVVIPDGVTFIGEEAFRDCTSLVSVAIPDSVTEIGRNAFMNCENLTSANIPDGVTEINGVFFLCANLTGIAIPDSVTKIGDYTFAGCASLTS